MNGLPPGALPTPHLRWARPTWAGSFVFHRLPFSLGVLACLALTALGPPAALLSDETARRDEGALRALVLSVRENIDAIRAEDPGNADRIAGEYLRLFDAFPDAGEGRLAAVEAYLLYRNASLSYQALALAQRMIRFYSARETFPNIADPEKPLLLVVSLRIECARLLTLLGNPFGAIERLRSIPREEVRGYAGMVDGARTYYGPTGALVGLGILDALLASGETRQAYLHFQELLRTHGGVTTYHEKRESALDRDLLDRIEQIRADEGWSHNRVLVEYRQIAETLHTDAARVRLAELTIRAHLRNYHEAGRRFSVFEARDLWLGLIDRYGELTERSMTDRGERIDRIGERALDAIADLYLREMHDPRGWIVFLSQLERRYGEAPRLHARCLLLAGDVQLQQMRNTSAALVYYNKVMDRYGDLVYYPHVLPEATRYRSVARDRIEQAGGGLTGP